MCGNKFVNRYVNQRYLTSNQKGMSLVGLIFTLGVLAMIVILAAKVAPTVLEYNSIKKAIVRAKSAGDSIGTIQAAYDKQADVDYITSIHGRDLVFEKTDTGIEVSFAYEKKIHLLGPASLLLEYEGTTGKPAKKTTTQD